MTVPGAPADVPSAASTVMSAGVPPVPAPPGWPGRRVALFLARAAQLITISALPIGRPAAVLAAGVLKRWRERP